jgi:hypothetical protein
MLKKFFTCCVPVKQLLNKKLTYILPGYIPGSLGFDSWCYQIFCDVGLEWPPSILVRINEELLERKCSGSGLENRE